MNKLRSLGKTSYKTVRVILFSDALILTNESNKFKREYQLTFLEEAQPLKGKDHPFGIQLTFISPTGAKNEIFVFYADKETEQNDWMSEILVQRDNLKRAADSVLSHMGNSDKSLEGLGIVLSLPRSPRLMTLPKTIWELKETESQQDRDSLNKEKRDGSPALLAFNPIPELNSKRLPRAKLELETAASLGSSKPQKPNRIPPPLPGLKLKSATTL